MSFLKSKPSSLSAAKRIGFDIPSSLITNDPQLARDFYNLHADNIVIKSLYHHRIDVQKKAYSMFTHIVSSSDLNLFETLVYAPCMLQERINIKYELRITVIGDTVFPVRLNVPESSWSDIHIHDNNQIIKTPIDLSEEIVEKCRKLIALLGLRYGAIDFVVDMAGRIVFLEVNPTGDWYWIEKNTGLPITDTMIRLIQKYLNN